MNIDHFMFQDVKELNYKFKIEGIGDDSDPSKPIRPRSKNDTFTITAKATYLNELRSGWSDLPTPPVNVSYVLLEPTKDKSDKKELRKFLKAIGGPWAERFSLSLVSPSIVPNFFPTLRVIEYNITGMENEHPAEGPIGDPAKAFDAQTCEGIVNDQDEEDDSDDEIESDAELHELKKTKKGKKKKPKKPKKPTFPVPKPPSKTSPPGPGYSSQPLSLLSITQYYANLTKIHEQIRADKSRHNPEKHFKYKVEYTTNGDKYYQINDLTVRSMLNLAERISRDKLKLSGAEPDLDWTEKVENDGVDLTSEQAAGRKQMSKTAKNRVWKEFIKRAFVHTKPDEEIDQDFG
jgi:endopolyphosphatase